MTLFLGFDNKIPVSFQIKILTLKLKINAYMPMLVHFIKN